MIQIKDGKKSQFDPEIADAFLVLVNKDKLAVQRLVCDYRQVEVRF